MAEVDAGAVAPVVPVAPASTDAPVVESTADTTIESPEGEDKPAAPERTFTQKELDEIVAKRAAQAARRAQKEGRLEAERDYWRQQAEARMQQPTSQPDAGEPKPQDFKDYESFVKAQARWEARQEVAALRRETEAMQQQREALERAHAVKEKLSAGAAKHPDFEEVVFADDLPISEPMAAAIAESDVSADLAYYLGQNRDEALRISKLLPTQQVREIAKLESKLAATPAPTRAPAPIVPNQTPAAVKKDPAKMTDKEFAEWRRRQKAQK